MCSSDLTAPAPLDGTGGCAGVGEGVGVGVGVGVALLFDRDGTLPVDTGDGDVGATAPQLIVTSASTIDAMTSDVRIRARCYARHRPEAFLLHDDAAR